MYVQYPNQKVSASHKHNNKEWAKAMAEYVIALGRTHNNKALIREFLSAANAEISEDKYKYLLARYESDKETKDIIATLRKVDFLTPIKEKLMGEFINSYHNYQAFVHDPDIIFRRNEELGNQVKAMIVQEIVNRLNEQGAQTGQASKEQPDINKEIEDALKKWRDDKAKEAQHILDYLNDITDVKNKYVEAFYYWIATNQCFTYRTVRNGEVYVEVKSPLECYRVDSGNMFVEDDDYFVCHEQVPFSVILDESRDILSKENIAYLETLQANMKWGEPIEATSEMLKSRIWMLDEQTKKQANFKVTFSDKHYIVDRWHCVFKTPIKQGILTYTDNLGQVTETIVDENYKLDPSKGDINLKWEYVNQVWEIWKYGRDAAAVYTKPKPVDVQRELVSNNSKCKLPYNGITWLNRHNKPNPVFYRIIDYLALYQIYTVQQERWVNKFKSWITFPESLISENQEMTTADRFAMADVDGMLIFNDRLNENPNATGLIKEIATTSVVNFIKILSELREQVKQEAMELVSWTPSRDGNVNPRQGKAVTEHSLAQSTNAAAWLYSVFNAMRERDYMANLDYSKFAWVGGKQGAYIDPNTNRLVEVEIDGATHAAANYGVSVRNSAKLDEMFTSMKDIAFAAAQGGELGMAADVVLSTNIFEVRDIIDKHVEATRQFQQQIEQMKNEGILQEAQVKKETEEMKANTSIQVAQIEAQSRYDTAMINMDKELTVWEMRLTQDTNGNGYIDKDEAMNDSGKDEARRILEERRFAFEKEKEAYKRYDADRKYELDKKKASTAAANKTKKK